MDPRVTWGSAKPRQARKGATVGGPPCARGLWAGSFCCRSAPSHRSGPAAAHSAIGVSDGLPRPRSEVPPADFGEIVGQEHVVRTLANALKTRPLAHAFLFTGPRGVGKTTPARLVAKALNCEQGPTADPCGVCSPCVEIAEGSARRRRRDRRRLEQRRRQRPRHRRGGAATGPPRDRYKVYIIDEVHMLSTGAFNALLKTLEEPPDAREVRARHDRVAQGPGDDPLALPALRLPPADAAADRRRSSRKVARRRGA